MPTVPRYEANQVREAALPSVKVDASVSEGAFGARESRAMGEAADVVARIADRYTKHADQIALMDAEGKATSLADAILYNKETGALHQRGEKAFTTDAAAKDAYDKGIADIVSGLNSRQKEAFQGIVTEKWNGVSRAVQRHIGVEQRRYDDEKTKAYVETKRQSAIENYQSPDAVAAAIDAQAIAIGAYADRNGLSADEKGQLLARSVSDVHAHVLERHMNEGDDISAEAYYKAHEKEIIGDQKIAASKALELATLRGKSQRASDEILKKHGTLTAAIEEAKKIDDPKLRDETTRRVHDGFAMARQAERLDLEKAHTNAVNIIEKTGSLEKIPPTTWARFSVSDRNQLVAYARSRARGIDPETKWDLYYDLKTRAASPDLRSDFLQTNLYRYRNSLADAEFKELVNEQTNMRSGKGVSKELDGFLTDMQIATQALREINVKPDSPRGTAFYRRMDQEAKRLQDRTGKKATNEELQGIADDLRIKGITDKGWLWDTKEYKFEAEPGGVFEIKASDVPKSERFKIESALRNKNIPVTDEAVLDLYKRMRGSDNGVE